MAKKKAKKTGRAAPKKDKRPARKKAPKKKGTKKASSRAKKKPKAKKRTKKATKKTAKKSTKRKTPTRRGKPASKTTRAKAKKEKRPIRWRYDDDGNVVGFYVPLKHRTKAEQKKASKKMVAACSAGAYRQGVGPKRTCGHRGLAPSSRAGRGLAYARWGFPKGFLKNPAKTYSVKGLLVRTFKDEDGDWGFAVMMPDGTILAGGTEEPSEKVAAREGKAEARYQAMLLEDEGRTMRNPSPPKIWTGISSEGKFTLDFQGVRSLRGGPPKHVARHKGVEYTARWNRRKQGYQVRRDGTDWTKRTYPDLADALSVAADDAQAGGGKKMRNPRTALDWKKGDRLLYGNAYADLDENNIITLTKIEGKPRYEIELIYHEHGHTHARGGGVVEAKSLAAAKKAVEERFVHGSGAKFPGRKKNAYLGDAVAQAKKRKYGYPTPPKSKKKSARKKNPNGPSMRSIMAKALK